MEIKNMHKLVLGMRSALQSLKREPVSLKTLGRGTQASSHFPLKGRMLWGALGAAWMALVILVILVVLVACPAAPSPGGGLPSVTQVEAARGHTCALLEGGRLKCWGWNNSGQLGLGDTDVRGDEPGEMGNVLPAIDLGSGRTATQIVANGDFATLPISGFFINIGHSCALLDNGSVKCWGNNAFGQLGQGHTRALGDSTTDRVATVPAIELGSSRTATQLAVGGSHSCALLDNGSVKCWGSNTYGRLGLGDTNTRGDRPGEMGNALPAIDLGSGQTATQIAAGVSHSCALLDNGSVKCWGRNGAGQLGLGDTDTRGDDESGDAIPAVDLGSSRTATQIAVGSSLSCALLDNGSIKCWGINTSGQLGLGDTDHRGDGPGEMGNALPAIDLGSSRTATQIAVGGFHSCALLDNGSVKCWGNNLASQLGLGDADALGDGPGEMGNALPAIGLGSGRTAAQIAAGGFHSCALLDNGRVKCWGSNGAGELGLGDTNTRGDEPNDMGDNLPFVDL